MTALHELKTKKDKYRLMGKLDKTKIEGMVFTPDGIVRLILDDVGYSGETILHKTIMEPSFGNGAFLKEIVTRIIQKGMAIGLSPDEISETIDKNVFGIEKDRELYGEAVCALNELLSKNNVPIPSWRNLVCDDALLAYTNYLGAIDFCVGNPPYVRIHNIDDFHRDVIRNFKFSDGMADLYITFYEIGIQMLRDDCGRLAYISPNSFLRNSSQRNFRNYLIEQGLLYAIYDFKDSKIFDAGTYPCICIIDKDASRLEKDTVSYREYNMYSVIEENSIPYDYFRKYLKNAPWSLSSKANIDYLQHKAECPVKIKDVAIVQNGIATNRDSLYTGYAWLDKETSMPYVGKHTDAKRLVWFNGFEVESTILHRCVKGSTHNGDMTNLYILYPYTNSVTPKVLKKSDFTEVETSCVLYSEAALKETFPYAYAYLQAHREELERRDMEPNVAWYAFARSQGLVNSGYKKIVFKHTISKSADTVAIHMLDEDVLVFAGLFITLDTSKFINSNGESLLFDDKRYDEDLKKVQEYLSTKDFHKYCSLIGKDKHGGYVSISSGDVKSYGVDTI